MFTRKSLLDIENLNLQQHTFRFILVQVKPNHTIHICTAGPLTRKKKKKLKKSSDWEATHDVSGRLILLRLEGRLWRWRARSFHCFSNKKPLWGATDPPPPPRWHLATFSVHKIPPRWHLGTSSVHKISPRWHKWISTSLLSTSSTTGQDGFQSDKISNVLRALSHGPLALL